MSNTSRLKLPFIMESQAQKEVCYNRAIEIIDVLLQASVISVDESTPPRTPKLRDCYVVSGQPKGSWEEHHNDIAYYNNGSWSFIEPFEGLTVWVKDEGRHYTYKNDSWSTTYKS